MDIQFPWCIVNTPSILLGKVQKESDEAIFVEYNKDQKPLIEVEKSKIFKRFKTVEKAIEEMADLIGESTEEIRIAVQDDFGIKIILKKKGEFSLRIFSFLRIFSSWGQ